MPQVVKLHPNQDPFDEFWRWYPRKTGKAVARAIFKRITEIGMKVEVEGESLFLLADPQEIIEGAKRYRKSVIDGSKCRWDDPKIVLKDDEKFVPHAKTWLRLFEAIQVRWEDD